MSEQEIYEKTPAGADEVKQRARGLPPRLRTMLIMVDGVRTVAQLDVAAQTLDAPRDYLASLLAQGLVRPRGAAGPPPVATVAGAVDGPPPATRPPAPAPAPDPAQRVPASEAERFRAAQRLMNETAVDVLGLRALLWTLRLERAATCDDLRQLLPDYCAAITRARGEAAAALMQTRVRSMLD